jgi:hypothetical protein
MRSRCCLRARRSVFFAVHAEALSRSPLRRQLCNRPTSQRVPEPWNTEAYDIVGIRCQETPSEDLEDIVCSIANGRVCALVIALYLIVVTSCKSAINPVINLNPIHSHSIT